MPERPEDNLLRDPKTGRKRLQVLVTVDLDPVPGTFATVESWEQHLNSARVETAFPPWYHPTFKVVGPYQLLAHHITPVAAATAYIMNFGGDERTIFDQVVNNPAWLEFNPDSPW